MSVNLSRYAQDIRYQIGVDHARRRLPRVRSYDMWTDDQKASYDDGRRAVEEHLAPRRCLVCRKPVTARDGVPAGPTLDLVHVDCAEEVGSFGLEELARSSWIAPDDPQNQYAGGECCAPCHEGEHVLCLHRERCHCIDMEHDNDNE